MGNIFATMMACVCPVSVPVLTQKSAIYLRKLLILIEFQAFAADFMLFTILVILRVETRTKSPVNDLRSDYYTVPTEIPSGNGL